MWCRVFRICDPLIYYATHSVFSAVMPTNAVTGTELITLWPKCLRHQPYTVPNSGLQVLGVRRQGHRQRRESSMRAMHRCSPVECPDCGIVIVVLICIETAACRQL